MKLYTDFDINNFGAWSGAVDTKESIINAGKANLFNSLVDDIFPDGCDDAEMNDYLWFESDSIFEMLGLNEDGEEPDDDEDEDAAAAVADFEDFDTFCESFGSTCEGCPIRYLPGDCETLFEAAKKEA
jgi:hypothetical protein